MTTAFDRDAAARLADELNRGDFAHALELAARLRGGAAPPPVAVSACLVGAKVRFDGGARASAAVAAALVGRTVLPLCPELLGGLGCPRPRVAFVDGDGDGVLDGTGRACDDRGRDRSEALREGARRALALAQAAGAGEAVLKERSPSCGCHEVHAASGLVRGRGVFAAAAARAGLRVRSDEDLDAP